ARDNVLVTLKKKLNQAELERDELKLKLDKFQSSSKNLTELLASQTNDKHGIDYFSSKSDSESLSPSSLSDRIQPSGRYHAVPPLITGTFMPPKHDLVFHTASIDVETDDSAFTVQLSPSKHAQELSYTTRPLAPIIEDWVSDSEDESEPNDPQSVPSFVQSTKQVKTPRHSVQLVKAPILDATPKPASQKSNNSSKRKNRKTCFVCRSVDHLIKDYNYHAKKKGQPTPRNYAHRGYNKQNASFTHKHPPKHMVPAAVLTQSKPVSITDVRPVSVVVHKIMVTRPRHAHSIYTKSKSPIRRYITSSPSPKTSNSPPRVIVAQAPVGNPQYALKDKEVIDSGCLRHITGNMSYLFDFDELNGGYVAFGGNPKGGKISGKGKIKTGNLVRGLLTKVFKNNNTCVACKKGNQHRASCKTKPVSSDDQPLFRLHMDLFGPTFVKSLNKKSYCLVITDDYSRFTWVFFLATKDETSPIIKTFITGLENKLSLKVKVIRSDNGTEFKNSDLNQFCKFEGKVDEGFLVGYSVNSKAFRVFNSRTHIVQETLHANFLENMPNIAGNQSNLSACFQDEFDAEKAREDVNQQYLFFPVWSSGFTNPHNKDGDDAFNGKEHDVDTKKPESTVNVSPSSSDQSGKQDDMNKKKAKGKSLVESFTRNRDLSVEVEDYSDNSSNDDNAAGSIVSAAGQNYSNNTNPFSAVGPSNTTASPTHRKSSFKDASQLLENPDMLEMEDITYSDHENVGAKADFNNLETSITIFNDEFHTCMFAYFLSQEEPKRVQQALKDPSWIEAMQEDVLQFKMQKVWILVDLPHGKRAIGTKWVYRNKKDERGIVQMDVKSAFLYGTIKKEVYVCQPLGFEDPDHHDKVYKVVKVKQKKDGRFISQDKYVAEILKKFGLTEGKSASTPIDTEKPLLKDPDVCACARFQVTPKASHLHAVKRIFRYLKGKPHLGLWYPKDSPFDLVAYSDSDYAGASLDRKSITGGCQFLGCRLISWQCKKQIVIATSSTEAEYVAAASCCAQVLWIQNQMLDYGYNFMHTIIYVDNSSTIYIIKNLVLHSKTKHIEIRHHFIRDCNEIKLIQLVKILTENNFVDLLTKAFDVGRFQYLIASIGLLNP
nr:hypothetical protein [Tanacetum cinerariifolium]